MDCNRSGLVTNACTATTEPQRATSIVNRDRDIFLAKGVHSRPYRDPSTDLGKLDAPKHQQ